jgi:hypothetical protein
MRITQSRELLPYPGSLPRATVAFPPPPGAPSFRDSPQFGGVAPRTGTSLPSGADSGSGRNPKTYGFPQAARRVIQGTSPDRWSASFMVKTTTVSDRLRSWSGEDPVIFPIRFSSKGSTISRGAGLYLERGCCQHLHPLTSSLLTGSVGLAPAGLGCGLPTYIPLPVTVPGALPPAARAFRSVLGGAGFRTSPQFVSVAPHGGGLAGSL